MAPTLKVALAQFNPKPVAVEENFFTAAEYIRSAASQGCDLAVLPEFHLTSWCPENEAFLEATRESNSYLSKYQDLAKELNINIVPGTICEIHPIENATEDGKTEELRNMTYFLAAGTGKICGFYQKKNLWHPERPHLTGSGSTPHTAFDTPFKHADGRPVRAGMLICWDLAFPEAFRALIADGAELIIIPSYWFMTDAGEAVQEYPDAEKDFLESATTLRAFENTAGVIFCNAGGLSSVTMPIQGAIKRLGIEVDELAVADIDLDILKVAEENYKIRKDIKSDWWHY